MKDMKTTDHNVESVPSANTEKTHPEVPERTVNDVVNEINIDSRRAPEEYADDLDIPGGGE